ncbi:MAG: hypothetical protein ABSF85_17950 [Terriglobales bacterium]
MTENPTLQLPNAVFIGFARFSSVHQNFQHPKEPYGGVERIIIWEPIFNGTSQVGSEHDVCGLCPPQERGANSPASLPPPFTP